MARRREFDLPTVLEGAMNVFWDKGFTAATAQDLVDGTGLGRGSLYNTFESKRDLFHQSLQRYDELWTSQQEAVLTSDGPLRERIRTVLMTVVAEETGEFEHRGCLAVNSAIELAGQDPEVDKLVRQVFERMQTMLHTAILQAQEDGEVSSDADPGSLARYVLNTMYGLRVLGKTATRDDLVGIVDMTLANIH